MGEALRHRCKYSCGPDDSPPSLAARTLAKHVRRLMQLCLGGALPLAKGVSR